MGTQPASEFSNQTQLRMAALRSAISDLTSALADAGPTPLDSDSVREVLEQLREVQRGFPHPREPFKLPMDAGRHADALHRLMTRIPRGYGRLLNCGPGWYPLLARLEGRISEVFPEMEVHQVKEKYGTLRFYWGSGPLPCCEIFQEDNPAPSEPFVLPLSEVWVAHMKLSDDHRDSEVHSLLAAERAVRAEKANRLVIRAERRSARTCELTGRPGVLMVMGGWYKTLDPDSAPEGYVVVPVDDLESVG